jgi:hypothetical protein
VPAKTTTPATPDTPSRRMTLSQVVEQLLHRGGGERSSVTLARNAKGETQIEVVVRTADNTDVETVDAALAKAIELYDQARRQYPMNDGTVGGAKQ